MNRLEGRCDICGGEAHPLDLLDCAFCGRRFHVVNEYGDGCGVITPNPALPNGC